MNVEDVDDLTSSILSLAGGQRRIRHLTRCLVRNISTERQDALAPSPVSRRPDLVKRSSADDVDLELHRRRMQGKRKISLTKVQRDRTTSNASTLTPIRSTFDADGTRPAVRSRTSSSISAVRPEALKDHDDETELLSPLRSVRRDRASSRASVLSQAGSSTAMRGSEAEAYQAQSLPQPEICLILSIPSPSRSKGKAPACFYASEVVTSRNATFELDPSTFARADEYLLRQSRFTAEVWMRAPKAEGWKVHMQWDVDLTRLALLDDDPASSTVDLPYNSVILSLVNGQHLTLPSNSASAEDRVRGASTAVNEGEEDDGVLSDPGSVFAFARDRQARLLEVAKQQEKDRRKRAIEVSKRETRMLPSVGVGGIVRLLTLQTCIDDMRALTEESQKKVSRLVADKQGRPHLRRRVSSDTARLKQWRSDLHDSQKATEHTQQIAKHRKEELTGRKESLEQAKKQLRSRKRNNERLRVEHSSRSIEHAALQRRIVTTRAEKVDQLGHIFPIRPSGGPLLFSISGAPLPNSVFEASGSGDDAHSSALGLTAHLVALLSHYIFIALPYPITLKGSRSLVSDPISSSIRGLRAFPLYSKGVDRYRFDYAVFLLNKDVEHLLNLHRPRPVALLDLKQTLPNIHNLMLTATADGHQPIDVPADSPHPESMGPSPSSSSEASESDGTSTADGSREATHRPPSLRSVRSTASGKTVRATASADEKKLVTPKAAEKLRHLQRQFA